MVLEQAFRICSAGTIMNDALKKGIIITIAVILLGLVIMFGLGQKSILFLGTSYNVGDTVSFTSSSSQGNSYYQGCKMDILFDGAIVECAKTGTSCGGTSTRTTCYSTAGIKLAEKDVGQRNIGVTYKGCTCKVNPVTSVCEPLLTPYGFSEYKTITVKSVATPAVSKCSVNQVLVNNICQPVPCNLRNGQKTCSGNTFIQYGCYNDMSNTCSGNYVCDVTASNGCRYVVPPEPEPTTWYKCDSNYKIITKEAVTQPSGYSATEPECEAPPVEKITCYTCIDGSVKTELVETCTNGYLITEPISCGEDVCTSETGTCFDKDGDKITYTTNCQKNELCVEKQDSVWVKFLDWLINLFRVN